MRVNFIEVVRAGKDAETRFTQGGKPVTSFSAAFDSGWGDNKKTVWLDCSLWGDSGEKLAQYIKKGTQLQVQGELGTRDHKEKTYITLNVSDVKLLGSKPDSAKPSRSAQSSAQSNSDPFPDDDFPHF